MKYAFFLSIFLLLLTPQLSFAQNPEASSTSTVIPTVTQSVDYVLPYPGLLPGNPFYGLKTLRDHIVGFLIADPLKKASFDLLQADKRLQAGTYLIQNEGQKKENIAEQTISKGENYLDEAVAKVQEAKTQGRDVTDLARTMDRALLKHEEVLGDLQTKVSTSEKKQFTTLINHVMTLEAKISRYTNIKK